LYMPLIVLFRKNKLLVTVIVLIAWFFTIRYGAFLPLLLYKVITYFIIWFSGMLLADMLLYKDISIKNAGIYLLLMIAGAVAGNFSMIGKEILLTVAIAVFLYLVLTTSWFNLLKKLDSTGAYSYTMYAMHMPVLCLLSGYIMLYNNGRLPSHFLFVPVGIVVSVVASWLLHFVGEKPFTKK